MTAQAFYLDLILNALFQYRRKQHRCTCIMMIFISRGPISVRRVIIMTQIRWNFGCHWPCETTHSCCILLPTYECDTIFTFDDFGKAELASLFSLISHKKQWLHAIRKSKDYVYGIWVYNVLGIWKYYYRVKKITSSMPETVNRGKKW